MSTAGPSAEIGATAVLGAPTPPLVTVRDLTRTFGSGRVAVRALRGASFTVEQGELVALRGRSGSGKTTLLNIVGGLDKPSSGTVIVAGNDLGAMSEAGRLRLRRSTVAFIFQSFGLLPALSAAENVGVPLRILGMDPKQREERVALLLDVVGLDGHAAQRPNELSGGQQQRVAVARALAPRPRLRPLHERQPDPRRRRRRSPARSMPRRDRVPQHRRHRHRERDQHADAAAGAHGTGRSTARTCG